MGSLMSEIDPTKLDIFTPTHSSLYNACVGNNSLHNLHTYAEGYLQAAKILLSQIFEKQLLYERDTLVHPILYSARHAIELSIKHVLTKLNECDIKTDEKQLHGHSLKELWHLFEIQTQFDRRLKIIVENVKPIVKQFDEADPDAQDFRYPKNVEGVQTLEGKFIVDLITVGKLVYYLDEKILKLFELIRIIVDERNLNAFTKEMNRDELRQLSIELPSYKTWAKSEDFEKVKQLWRKNLGLSNNAFSRAVNFIKNHREFAGNIGIEHDFISLNEELLREVMATAYDVKKERIADREIEGFARMIKPDPSYKYLAALTDKLSADAIAELSAIFYISRDHRYSEEFDFVYNYHQRDFKGLTGERLEKAKKQSFFHVFSKSNFINEVVGGLGKIGKLSLAKELEKYIINEELELQSLGVSMEF